MGSSQWVESLALHTDKEQQLSDNADDASMISFLHWLKKKKIQE